MKDPQKATKLKEFLPQGKAGNKLTWGTAVKTKANRNTPLAVSPLIELELRGKNERVARRETKRLIYKLKVLGQPVTSEVRSSAEIDENP